ncbi:MAG: cation-efflux pump [Anaerolineae bacterium]
MLNAEREKRAVALSSVVAALFLALLKLLVGIVTGSLGILSEAAHSALDLAAALITYFAVRVSDRPADTRHLYGHGKVENFSALVETLLLLATCAWIIYEATARLLIKTVVVEANIYAFTIMLLSIGVNFSRSRALYHAARKHQSQALEADALHFASDILSSAVVIIGLIFVRFGFPQADPLAAMAVAAVVVVASLRLGKQTVEALMDTAPEGLAHHIEEEVKGVDGVLDCQRLRLRRAGSAMFVDMNISIDRTLPFERAHTIASAVEKRVQALIPRADVLVHIEPTLPEGDNIVRRIRAIASNSQLTIHSLRLHDIAGQLFVELHLEVEKHLSLKQAHYLASQLENRILSEIKGVEEVNTHIEPLSGWVVNGDEVTLDELSLVRQVEQIARKTAGLRDCHKVTVRRVGDKFSISLHCVFDEDLPIEEAHHLSSTIEDRLRERRDDIEQVLVHVEPAAVLNEV